MNQFLKLIFIHLVFITSTFSATPSLFVPLKQFNDHQRMIPSKLLEAIAVVESGQMDLSKKQVTPWPWTIHVNGKGGYTYSTKQQAIAAIRSFQSQGYDSIDVGIMQVNLKYHPNAFKNLDEALDPQKNIAYAAKFLYDLYLRFGSWHKAIAHYHSSDPNANKVYLQKVLKAWAHSKAYLQGSPLIMPVQGGPLFQGNAMPLTIPQQGHTVQTSLKTNSQKAIPIDIHVQPLAIAKPDFEKEQKAKKELLAKKENKNLPSGKVFPLKLTVQNVNHVSKNGTPQKATPIILTVGNVMPLR
jgi:hypothetical protein